MKCWFCGGNLVWQNDFSFEDYGVDGDGIVAVLCCAECNAHIECYSGEKEDE